MTRARPPDPEKDLTDPAVPLTDAEREWIRRETVRRQESESISNHAMGLALGYRGGAVWSQVRRGKYAGDVDKCLRRAYRWLLDRSGRETVEAQGYVETSVGRHIHVVCDRAWRHSLIGVVAARAGLGKTLALAEFARRRGRQAILLRIGETLTTQRGLLTELVTRLGLTLSRRPTLDEMARAIREHLAASYAGGKGAPFAILVDEATRIQARPLNLLREFCDHPDCRAALVLAGTLDLLPLLASKSWVHGGTDQIRRRIVAAYTPPADEPVAAEDVEAIVRSVLGTIGWSGRIAKSALSYLREVADGDGAFGAVANRLYAVRDLAEAVGVTPRYTAEELDYAGTLLFAQPRKWPDRRNPFGRVGEDGATGAAEAAERRTA